MYLLEHDWKNGLVWMILLDKQTIHIFAFIIYLFSLACDFVIWLLQLNR